VFFLSLESGFVAEQWGNHGFYRLWKKGSEQRLGESSSPEVGAVVWPCKNGGFVADQWGNQSRRTLG
jgi:hypothetical protein